MENKLSLVFTGIIGGMGIIFLLGLFGMTMKKLNKNKTLKYKANSNEKLVTLKSSNFAPIPLPFSLGK